LRLVFEARPGEAGTAPTPPAAGPIAGLSSARDRLCDPSHSAAVTVFVRHPRARRYLLRLIDERTIRVTLPRWGSKKEAVAFVERERPWIDKQRRRFETERARCALDRHAPVPAADTPIAPDAERLRQAELIEQARRVLPARLNELASFHGLTVTRVSIRNQHSRWGSCSRTGHICLNWRLVTMPGWVRDYVIIHELMHLKRMDHSKRFWKLVASACPAYQSARRYLREHAMTLMPGSYR